MRHAKVDAKSRVRIPELKPGDLVAVERPKGRLLLSRIRKPLAVFIAIKHAKVDAKSRVRVPDLKPGEIMAVEANRGRFLLSRMTKEPQTKARPNGGRAEGLKRGVAPPMEA